MTQNHEEDLYIILGIAKQATKQEIRRAYKQLAQKYHPDKNNSHPEYAELFKKIKYAYDILSNHEKRTAYDNGESVSIQPEVTREQLIKSTLAQIFMKSINARDPIKAIEQEIRTAINGNQNHIVKIEKEINNLTKAKDKLLFRTDIMEEHREDDIFIMAINHQIREAKIGIEKKKEEIELGKDMMKMLEDYMWKKEEVARVYVNPYSSLGPIFDTTA